MDTRSGEIIPSASLDEYLKQKPNERQHFKEMKVLPTKKQMARKPPKIGRNERCPCGSGKKFKKCCLE